MATKPIDDRTAVNAALDKFIQRQMHRSHGIVSWLRDAKLWRTVGSPERERIGGFMADINAERCESVANDMVARLLAHVSRIRQLDASRRATAIVSRETALRRDRHPQPTPFQLLNLARQAVNGSEEIWTFDGFIPVDQTRCRGLINAMEKAA